MRRTPPVSALCPPTVLPAVTPLMFCVGGLWLSKWVPPPPVTIAETWLINATFGTLSDKTFNVSFVSNDTEYSQFWIGLRMGDYQIRYDDTLVFDADGAVWQNQAYRTIGLYEPASGDFLTWLNANAVKQS